MHALKYCSIVRACCFGGDAIKRSYARSPITRLPHSPLRAVDAEKARPVW